MDTLYKHNLIDDEFKEKVIINIKHLAVSIPDSGFIWLSRNRPDFFINESDVANIMSYVKENLTLKLDDTLINWELNDDTEEDPNEHYDLLLEALNDYIIYFKESPEEGSAIISKLSETCDDIDDKINEIEEYQQMRAQYEEDHATEFREEKFKSQETLTRERNRFDDVDS